MLYLLWRGSLEKFFRKTGAGGRFRWDIIGIEAVAEARADNNISYGQSLGINYRSSLLGKMRAGGS